MVRTICLCMAIVAFVVNLAAPANGVGRSTKEKLSAVVREDYAKVFLGADDLPGMKMRQDSRHRGADPQDAKYRKLGGMHSGLTVWTPEDRKNAPIHRLVDIRWVFPSAAAAREYLKSELSAIGEGMAPVKDVPRIGEEIYVFGGIFEFPGSIPFRNYIMAFRQGNVVVKFYAMHSDANSTMRPATLAPFCQKIVARINATQR